MTLRGASVAEGYRAQARRLQAQAAQEALPQVRETYRLAAERWTLLAEREDVLSQALAAKRARLSSEQFSPDVAAPP